jgi:pimeloyl-ACP methyl ester carboxylesterase
MKRRLDRSHFLRTMGVAIVASEYAMSKAVGAQPMNPPAALSLGPIKQISAGALNIGYADVGPAGGPVVICLHGWPYDIYAYGEVAPLLASAGYRVIVPYLRGFGPTRFTSKDTFRNGEQLAFALDTIALMDALKIDKAILAGYDYGGRAACIAGALWPERCRALVLGQGYTIVNYKANEQPLPPKDELGLWFQYYFCTPRGALGYADNLQIFNNLMWHWLSPKWDFDDATYERTAGSFDNPDHVAIVIHNFRTRYGFAKGDPQYDTLNAKLQAFPVISVPTITVATDFDGANATGASYRNRFSGPYEHRFFSGFGHNVPQEDPHDFAQAIIDAGKLA